MKSGKNLDKEDRILWDRVRHTIVPRHKIYDIITINESFNEKNTSSKKTSLKTLNEKNNKGHIPLLKNNKDQVKKAHMPPHVFDRPTHRKIAKGRIILDGRIDLHGLSQDSAYALLYRFLQNATQSGFRHVLVITGKGRSLGSEGVLRQSVPHWLTTLPFRHFISAFEDAAHHHGGHGALYIRLRRMPMGLDK